MQSGAASDNAIRSHCAAFGLIAAQGVTGSRDLVERIRKADISVLPDMAKAALAEQFYALVGQIQALNRRPLAWHRQDQASLRLATIPGVGVLSAAALEASVTAPVSSDRVRNFPLRWAWSRDRTDQAAKTGWVITLRWETANAGSCS